MENFEMTIKTAITNTIDAAKNIEIIDNDDYEKAGNTRKEIKFTLKNISNYWTPKKDQAFQLHKSLVAAEKEMTQPLERADKIIDQKMGEYRREQDRIRMEMEREKRRIEEEAWKAAEEAARLVKEASQKDELDDDDVAILRLAQEDLERTQNLSTVLQPEMPTAKVQGITIRKVWKARIIDESVVPISIAGIIIRPIDQSALNKLAVASSGGFECPGIVFYQEEFSQVRL